MPVSILSTPSLDALMTHERMTLAHFVEQHRDGRAGLIDAASRDPKTSGALLILMRLLQEGEPMTAAARQAARNATPAPITCPDCGAEIPPDADARVDVLAALDAYRDACLASRAPVVPGLSATKQEREAAMRASRAALLALLGIQE